VFGLQPPEPLLTVAEVCTALRISQATAWRRIRAGDLRAVQLGGTSGSAVRVPASAMREFVKAYNGDEVPA
jgi:excisionase family DNA binding protein